MNVIVRKMVGVIRIKGRHISLPLLIALLIAGCGEQGRAGKGSEDLIPAIDLGTTIGSLAEMSWPESIRLEGYNLVVGLRGTGSAECPPQIRAYLAKYILTQLPGRKINVEKFIRGPDTAVLLVEGIMPAVASKNGWCNEDKGQAHRPAPTNRFVDSWLW